ncbi:DUF2061 domain-containing protein [Marinoscillum pacificum]|uniref:DUF2061 domain-containing protein n=1 Tax=Marinoscillum pacificum TaxID=392723 RepID=UPI00215717D4|nr:DUF2061 domain-containing protein [Marinoscillum pacificum]
MKDSSVRSITKAVSWRVIGTIDTIVLSAIISGHLVLAISIGFTELLTKTILYYLHERIWNQFTWGRTVAGPTHFRSLTKSISWRTIGTLDTIALAYFYTGQFNTAVSIGGLELFTKIALYYLHERIWARFKWGRSTVADKPSVDSQLLPITDIHKP